MNAFFDAIIHASIRNRVLVLSLATVIALLSLWSLQTARLDALPNFTPPIVVVQAEAPGLGSSTVERLVTTPLEQALLGITDVTRVRSTSSPGLSIVQLTFKETVDVFRARQLVSERIAEVHGRLPPTIPSPRLAPITASVGSLLKFCYSPSPFHPNGLQAVRQFAEWKVRPRLQAIEGIARVSVHGGAASRVEVRPDPARMLGRGVALSDLRHALTAAQSFAPLGFSVAGSQQEPVRADGLWTWGDLESIANTVIKTQGGFPVRVTDVAEVESGEAPAVGSARYDGQPAIYVQIEKLPWADTVRLTEEVESALAALDAELPPDTVRHPPTFRQADFIHTSVRALARSIGIGAFFVMIVLVAFLRSLRLAAISLTALPLSILAAVAVLLARGVTVNGMILGGLALAVGEVVDDAIVDVENIWRRLRENSISSSPRPVFDVIHDASVEVRGAVVYASLIVVAVLLPIFSLRGLAGRIFSPLAETYALAVSASLLVALTVTPALSATLLPPVALSDAQETPLARTLVSLYDRLLFRVTRHPKQVVLIALTLGVAALVSIPFIGGGFLPELREGVLIMEATVWPGTSLAEATRIGERIDLALRRDATVRHVALRAGRASLDEDAAPVHRMELDMVLSEGRGDPEAAALEILARMREFPGVQFGVEGFIGERINELLSGERAPIAIKLYSNDIDRLRSAASVVMSSLGSIDDIFSVRSADLVDVPTADLHIDEAKIAIAGIRRGDVVDAVAAWRYGLPVAEVYVPGGLTVPIVLVGPGEFRARSRLGDIPIFTASSAVLPLSSLVTVRGGTEPPTIHHDGGRRTVTITARTRTGGLSTAASQLDRLMDELELPSDISWQLAGQAAERDEATSRLLFMVAVVFILVFAFLWMAFGSVVDAGVVLGGLPLGMTGGVVAALLLPEGLSMAGLVGFVALGGIISRNGIMLVAHKNQLRTRMSTDREEDVVLQAARERLLPIVMTTATAFFGLLPLALSVGSAGSELEAPTALIVCAGLLSATLLNLVAVPCFYVWRSRRQGRLESCG